MPSFTKSIILALGLWLPLLALAKPCSEEILGSGLRRTTREDLSIVRTPGCGSFCYESPDGTLIDDPDLLARVQRLRISPFWTKVWMSPDPDGHLQAFAVNDSGSSRYFYNQKWTRSASLAKYDSLTEFGDVLPKIRTAIRRDFRKTRVSQDKVAAAIIQLIEKTQIRIGNKKYVEKNHHYGLTTLLKRQVKINGDRIHFSFYGKAGQKHLIDLDDPPLARFLVEMKKLPGPLLFQYSDESGDIKPIQSSAVNDYLKTISGTDVSAKMFRTWAATAFAVETLCQTSRPPTAKGITSLLTDIVTSASQILHNLPGTAKSSYIDLRMFAIYKNDSNTFKEACEDAASHRTKGLSTAEEATMDLLDWVKNNNPPYL